MICSVNVGLAMAKGHTGNVPQILSIRADASSVTLYGAVPLNYNTFQLLDPLRLVVDVPNTQMGRDVQRELRGNNHPIIKVLTQSVRKKGTNLVRVQIYLSELIPHRIYKRDKVLTISFPSGESRSDDQYQNQGRDYRQQGYGRQNGASQGGSQGGSQTSNSSSSNNYWEDTSDNQGNNSQGNDNSNYYGNGNYSENADSNGYYYENPANSSGNNDNYYPREQADPTESDSDYYETEEIISGKPEKEKDKGLRASSISEEELPYSGEVMTLDVVDADVVKIFTQMTALAGKNIVVDPDVRGEITLRMENAPWDQILTYILKVHDLGIEEEGNVIRIAKRSKLKRERDEERQLREAEKLAKETRTEIIYLSYARASQMASKVKQILSKRGDIIVDDRTNSLIITDIPEYLESAKRLITTLDIKNKQVTIYAQIVSSKKSFSRSLGIQWGGGFQFGPATGNPGKYAFPYYGAISDGSFLSNASPYAFNLPPTDNSIPFFGLTFGNIMDTFQLRAALHAAESEGMTRIVANPRITTSDNVSADIRSGVEIPFPVLTDRGVTTDFRSATISLNVTLHITVDDNISMRIRVTNDSVDRSFSPPGKLVNSANTELLVGNGDTFVIGGLNQTEAGTSSKKFPWLHRIPGLGKLFRSTETGNTFNDLLIFITPQIVVEEERKEAITDVIETIQEEYNY